MRNLDESIEPFGYVTEGGMVAFSKRGRGDRDIPVFVMEQMESEVRTSIVKHLLRTKLKIANISKEGYCDITAMKAVNIIDSVISEVYADD